MGLGRSTWLGQLALLAAVTAVSMPASAQQQPNIIMIMGDDIGIWNTGAYHRGLISTSSLPRA
jgi:arylsulfatase